MRIGQFGKQLRTINQIKFLSHESLFDYDLLFVDLNSFMAEFYNEYYDREKISTSDRQKLEQYINNFRRRQKDISEYKNAGKVIVYFIPAPLEVSSPNDYRKLNISELLVGGGIPIRSEGINLDVIPKTRFSSFFNQYIDWFKHIGYFEENIGEPLLYINGTKKIVARIVDEILFIPHIKNFQTNEAEKIFIDSLIKLLLEKEPKQFELPEWHSDYLLPNEKSKNENLIQLNQKLEEIKNAIQKEKFEINELQKFKILFIGTGIPLEKQVEKIFTDLGCETLVVEKDRDDLILKWNDKVAVIEVKGVTGSSAEKYARQLEQWVAQKEEQVKGILITNGFKDFKLEQRKQDVFPDQMLKYSKQREHCLISGLQLLGLYFDCLKNSELKEEKLQSLFDTVGVYKGYENWNEFIEMNKNEN